ncbi:MAG: hypothetical protein GKR95_00960 [Gammaproteobacteria bacterium]|nr:hypothetical protein [Gammaproteobacteria bacterium]
MTPNQVIKYLQSLNRQLGSSKVRLFFESQPPRIRNEYSLLRGDVSQLLGILSVQRLESVAEQLEAHSKEIESRTEELKEQLKELSSARRILTQLNKAISLVGRIAIYLV